MRTIFYAIRDARRLGIASRVFYILVALQLATSVFELAGLASFVPIFQYLKASGDQAMLVRDSELWASLFHWSEQLGAPLNLVSLLIASFIIVVARQVFTTIAEFYQINMRERETARVRSTLFDGFLHANSDYQDRASSGGLVSDMSFNAMRAVLHIFGRFSLVTLIAICFTYFVGMLLMDTRMTFLVFAVIFLAGIVVLPFLKTSRRLGQELVVANQDISSLIVERLKVARLVRLCGMEARESATIAALARTQGEVTAKSWRVLGYVDSSLEFIAFGAALIIIYVATTSLNTPIEIIGLFLTMLLRLLPVVRQIARAKQTADASYASYEALIQRLSELRQSRESTCGTASLKRITRGISFCDVSFSYFGRAQPPALSQVTAIMPAEKMTAIVGPSGSGKSTFVDLLPRLRVPSSGRIMFDGVDAAEIELRALRKAISFVSQTPLVFNVPVIEHIRYGAPNSSLDDVRRAAQMACADEFIMALPNEYETLAGEGGNLLSGGQRQRLDLARALLSKAPVLILDEPTSSLDAESAHQFLLAIDRVRSETATTIIMITHHLPSIRDADHIIVLNNGAVEAQGHHGMLMTIDSWYASAYSRQTSQLDASDVNVKS